MSGPVVVEPDPWLVCVECGAWFPRLENGTGGPPPKRCIGCTWKHRTRLDGEYRERARAEGRR